MAYFRKKPVVIEAVQWDTKNTAEVLAFMQRAAPTLVTSSETKEEVGIIIPTLEGNLTASPQDWIIKGVKGEFYPCKPDIFELTYEPF